MITEKQLKILLRKVRQIQDFLYDNKITSTNNIVGSLGEYFVCKRLKLNPAPKNNPDWDAIDKKGKKYQIKTRQAHKSNPSPHLYKIQKINYDYIILVKLDENFCVAKMWKLSKNRLKKFLSKSGSLNSKKIPVQYQIK